MSIVPSLSSTSRRALLQLPRAVTQRTLHLSFPLKADDKALSFSSQSSRLTRGPHAQTGWTQPTQSIFPPLPGSVRLAPTSPSPSSPSSTPSNLHFPASVPEEQRERGWDFIQHLLRHTSKPGQVKQTPASTWETRSLRFLERFDPERVPGPYSGRRVPVEGGDVARAYGRLNTLTIGGSIKAWWLRDQRFVPRSVERYRLRSARHRRRFAQNANDTPATNVDVPSSTNTQSKPTWEELKAAAHAQIDQSDLDHWHSHGYVLIPFLTPSEVADCLAEFGQYMPTWEEYVLRKPMFTRLLGGGPPRGWVRHDFPYSSTALNRVALHPYLVAFAERLTGSTDLQLSHDAIVGKYAGNDYDQELHQDYTNNTLVVPRAGTASIDIPMIVYYTDVTLDLGPSVVVPSEHTRHLSPNGRRFYSREEFPEIYEHELPATVRAGSVLVYTMRTFHRGSKMLAMEGCRFSQFVAFHTAGTPWFGSHCFQLSGGKPEMDKFVTHASPREREMTRGGTEVSGDG
ncbi:hypothetical protein DACRYDRAFT_102815 [Dacryopinax primogenitus]|uniref:PhyH-domain-containing protein n=1 Tax=Dacryopinax primogenitus (strain DJM 731) TaxID=1858805 RepID=M5FN10_DACPD|nr:uncharacterized protein DACRYDRAFT_102815 [Dacryopinax primogenitus]EJT96630.1 hypothetical protein DACRYDRAFT_102815 [Dacryopinax primogenitus]